MSRQILFVVTIGTLALESRAAFAFAEDFCFPEDGGAARNCSVLPNVCLPVGTETVACKTAAASAFVLEGARTTGIRSTIHADATHLMAQAVGFSADDAYWIAAYDEVADYGVFEAFGPEGQPYGGGALKTATLDGFVRTNASGGGMLLHFVAPYNGGSATAAAGVNGLRPDAGDPKTEPMLAHLRAWAMAGSGATPIECMGGITIASVAGDYATGTSCYPTDGGAANLHAVYSMVGPIAVSLDLATGLQIIASDGGAPTLSTAFDSLVGGDAGRIANARLGIYLHALGDRISHHVCSDISTLAGPDAGTWSIDMTNSECAQGIHALRHMWETGVDFSLLKAQDKTTEAGLDLIYDELVTFAGVRGVLNPAATDGGAKSALLGSILTALQLSDAVDRVSGIAAIACARGLAPFPGVTTCADAGVDAGADAGAGAGADAGADAGAVADAGAGAVAGAGGSGCKCSLAPTSSMAGVFAAFAATVALIRRRRKQVGQERGNR